METLKVKVRYFTTLRELAGKPEEEWEIEDSRTLGGLIENVASKYGKEARDYLYHESKSGKIDPSIYFLINGANSRTLSGLDTELKDGDIVAIIPPIGGGSSSLRKAKVLFCPYPGQHCL